MKYLYLILVISLLNISSHSFATHWWTGAINQLWNNPGNWDAGTIPGIGDDVIIPAGTTNECWVSSANQSCNNLFIMGGASLRIYDETLNVYGLMQIWGQLKMDHIDGFLFAHGNIQWETGSTALITAYACIRTNQNWEFASGSNVHLDDGYVQMFGYDDNEIISKSLNSYFNTLIIGNNGGVIDFSSSSTAPLTINGNLSITGGDTFTSHSSQDIVLNGQFSYNNGHFIFYNGTFIFNGSASNVRCNSGDYFNDLTINSTGNISLVSNIDVNGDLTINDGNLMCSNYTIRVVGYWDNNIRPDGFDAGTGTVLFFGTGNQYCYGDDFYNLTIDKANSSTYISIYPTPGSSYQSCSVANELHIEDGYIELMDNVHLLISDLTIDAASKLDAYNADNAVIEISGSWEDKNSPDQGYIRGTSKVVFSGGSTQQLTAPSLTSYQFYNVTVNKSNNFFTSALDLTIYGDLYVDAGGWTFISPTVDHYYYGDIILAGGGFYEQCNTHFVGGFDQTIDIQSPSLHDMGPMFIELPSHNYDVTVLGDWAIYTSGEVMVESGTFILDGSLFQVNNDLFVHNDGVFDMINGSELHMGNGSQILVYVGGRFQTKGSVSENNIITHYNSGYYTFNISSGTILQAKHTTFEYMDTDGINVREWCEVDTDYPFDYCTFRNGQSGGSLLQLECEQDLIIANAVFPTNTWGSSNNVRRTSNIGTITFSWARGNFAGELYDYDLFGNVLWMDDPTLLSVKVFLEGAFESSDMNTGINSILPLNQPYSTAPWNYAGSESVPSIPSTDIVDWILYDVRATDSFTADAATEENSIALGAAFLKSDGTVIDINENSEIELETAIGTSDKVFLVIYHRNHLPVINDDPLEQIGNVYQCDLSGSFTAIYGGLDACTYLAPGIYGMIAGDVNADGFVNAVDLSNWELNAGFNGYLLDDLNMDTQINNLDKNDKLIPNIGSSTQIP